MLPNFNFINKKTNYLFSKFHIFLKCIYKEKKVWKFADKEMDRWTDLTYRQDLSIIGHLLQKP